MKTNEDSLQEKIDLAEQESNDIEKIEDEKQKFDHIQEEI